MPEDNRRLFEEQSVFQVILRLAVPTIISQIILVIYNMADTFYIGMTESDVMLSAVTVCLPAFMFLSAIANLFGIGGAAVISRAHGARNQQKAIEASGFAIWGCIGMTLVYSLLAWTFIDPYIRLLGGFHSEVHSKAKEYLMITVVIGGVFTSMNSLMSHLMRSEGRSRQAGFGIALGGVLNIALDPLWMFVILPKGHEVLGAAIATALSNAIALAYFMLLLRRVKKEGSDLTVRFLPDSLKDGTMQEVLKTGSAACIMTLFENISYAVLDHLMAYAGIAHQAGIGVAKKVNMLSHSIVRGMSQGVLPLIAYTFAHRNYTRMKKTILISSLLSVGISTVCMGINLIFAKPLIDIFTADGPSQMIGAHFLRILCAGCPFSAFAYAIISFMQATGEDKKSFALALLRKGLIDIPLMVLLFSFHSADLIVLATPVADFICCMTAAVLFVKTMQRLKQIQTERHHSNTTVHSIPVRS